MALSLQLHCKIEKEKKSFGNDLVIQPVRNVYFSLNPKNCYMLELVSLISSLLLVCLGSPASIFRWVSGTEERSCQLAWSSNLPCSTDLWTKKRDITCHFLNSASEKEPSFNLRTIPIKDLKMLFLFSLCSNLYLSQNITSSDKPQDHK